MSMAMAASASGSCSLSRLAMPSGDTRRAASFGLTRPVTATLSTLIYREPFTAGMGIGLVCVIAGVLLVETGSRAGESEPRAGAADR